MPARQGTCKKRLVRLALPQLCGQVKPLQVVKAEALGAAGLLEQLRDAHAPAGDYSKGTLLLLEQHSNRRAVPQEARQRCSTHQATLQLYLAEAPNV